MKINGIEIKPGMILCGSRGDMPITLVAIPHGTNCIAFVNVTEGGWCICYETTLEDIIQIRDHPNNANLVSGKLLWEKPKEVVISLKEIAKKFGIPENVKIVIKD